MQNVIALTPKDDEHRIVASSSRAAEPTCVLKHADMFAVFGRDGDIRAVGAHGLYQNGTRYLSQLELRLNGLRPLLLSSTTRDDNHAFGADLTNPDFLAGDTITLEHDRLHIFRWRFLWNGCCHERLRLMNYGLEPVSLGLTYEFAADFRDVFEVRGTPRRRSGTILEPRLQGHAVELSYRGLDEVIRTTRLSWADTPSRCSADAASFDLLLRPQQAVTLELAVECQEAARPSSRQHSEDAFAARIAHDAAERLGYAVVEASDARFNDWVARSAADVRMMTTLTAYGRYPYAGVPWFNTVFGRDGIISALALLWVNPAIAEGVLRQLAATQATAVIREQDAEPGKILHEARGGEMAALGDVPFGRYYGSVDSTPLFVVLAGAYFRRTGNIDLIESIWPNIQRALDWIEQYGDLDGDGFVEYARRSQHGLVHQGWKDSHDSVFHADGTLAAAPIALCEVQGYVYDAWRTASELAEQLDRPEDARHHHLRAERLRQRFEDLFWCEDLGTYALALDGNKAQCRVRAASMGGRVRLHAPAGVSRAVNRRTSLPGLDRSPAHA